MAASEVQRRGSQALHGVAGGLHHLRVLGHVAAWVWGVLGFGGFGDIFLGGSTFFFPQVVFLRGPRGVRGGRAFSHLSPLKKGTSQGSRCFLVHLSVVLLRGRCCFFQF